MDLSSSSAGPILRSLNENNLLNLQLESAGFILSDQLSISDLDYPCKDKSRGVKDFRDWKFFKDKQEEKVKVKSMQASSIWCAALLDRVNRQSTYFQDTEIRENDIVAKTPLNKTNLAYRMRIQRAKAAAGRFSRAKDNDAASDGATVNTDFSVRSKGKAKKKGSLDTKPRNAPSLSSMANKNFVEAQVVKNKRDPSPASMRDPSPAKKQDKNLATGNRDVTPSKRLGSATAGGAGAAVSKGKSTTAAKSVAFAEASLNKQDRKSASSGGGRPPTTLTKSKK